MVFSKNPDKYYIKPPNPNVVEFTLPPYLVLQFEYQCDYIAFKNGGRVLQLIESKISGWITAWFFYHSTSIGFLESISLIYFQIRVRSVGVAVLGIDLGLVWLFSGLNGGC